MKPAVISDARERILNASIKLFSEKGFDATRVNEIADAAKVNKALIYYYFKSKEDILDCMLDLIIKRAVSITLDFIHANIVQMIEDGRLDIKPDRMHFVDEEAKHDFLNNAYLFHNQVVDFVIDNRQIIRILMLESLKSGKHRNDLFRLLNFTKGTKDNPIFNTISDADLEFNYSDDMVLFKFFFSIIPLICFAAFYEDYQTVTSLTDEELRSSFLRCYQILTVSLVEGSDILLRNNIGN